MKTYLIPILALSIIFVVLSGVSNSAAAMMMHVYDFRDPANSKAFKGSDVLKPAAGPGTPPEIGEEFAAEEYQNISARDDRWAYSSTSSYDYHRFKFTIDEAVQSITQIYVEHEGYAYSPEGDEYGVKLYIWNCKDLKWESVGRHNASSDAILSGSFTSDLSRYVDQNGYLQLLAEEDTSLPGSCPFLYSWDGERYQFVADLYGEGILGLPTTPRPDDCVKIDEFQGRNGLYSVQIAQEYDEISYLDKAELIVVDHPFGYETYTSLLRSEAGKLYTVSMNPRAPISCVDEHNNDCLQQISKGDGIYTEGGQYEMKILQLNLGDLSGTEEIKLVLTGYTYWIPDTIPTGANPYERFIQVRDRNGNWATILQDLQIDHPAGMPRTYVVDLTGRFITNDYSIRIGFNADVRWDCIGVDTSRNVALNVTTLCPVSADLHYRGYSKLKGEPLRLPDYYDVRETPPTGFSNPIGNFTRFGDVLPLLAEADDEFVIMHHGDEISVRFDYVPQSPVMDRDIIFHSFGYYKNRYCNTGTTVEPLPFRDMSSYPYPANDTYPSDPDHLAYVREYNTRYYDGSGGLALLADGKHYSLFTDYVMVQVVSGGVGGEVFSVDILAFLIPWISMGLTVLLVGLVFVRKKKTIH